MFWISLLGQMASHVTSVVIQYELLWWVYKTTGNIGDLVIAGMLLLLPAALFRGLADMVMEHGNPRASVITSLLVGVVCITLFVSGIDWLAMYDWALHAILFIYGIVHMVQATSWIALTKHFVRQDRLLRFDVVSDFLECLVLLTVVALGVVFLSDLPLRLVLFVCMLFSVLAMLTASLFLPAAQDGPMLPMAARYDLRGVAKQVSDVIGGVQLVFLLGVVLLVLTAYFMLLSAVT